MTLRDIEKLKYRASWYNSLGAAVISGGIIAPFVAVVTGSFITASSIGLLAIWSGIALWAGFALHETGAKFIDEMSI